MPVREVWTGTLMHVGMFDEVNCNGMNDIDTPTPSAVNNSKV